MLTMLPERCRFVYFSHHSTSSVTNRSMEVQLL